MNERAQERSSWIGAPGPARDRRASASSVAARLHGRNAVLEDAILRTRAARDGEAIHDLRVASRRLLAFLRVWRDLLPGGCVKRIARELRALRRRVGPARDLEVELDLLRERMARHAEPDEEARALLSEREARLERRRLRAARRVRPARSEPLLGLLARAEQGMSADLVSHLEAYESAHALERRRSEEALAGVEAALAAPEDGALHRARIAIKKWRYAVESLGGNEPPGDGEGLERLRELQRVLGAILDRDALRQVVARRVGRSRGASRTLPHLLVELEAERSEEVRRFQELGRAFVLRVR